MRKKELIKILERDLDYWKRKYEAEIGKEKEKKINAIPEMRICNCEICGAKKLQSDMDTYKERYSSGWRIYSICKKCPTIKQK